LKLVTSGIWRALDRRAVLDALLRGNDERGNRCQPREYRCDVCAKKGISRNRRLARDFERYARTVAAFFRLAMIRIVLSRLTRPTLSA
jgi:hypothetical protein